MMDTRLEQEIEMNATAYEIVLTPAYGIQDVWTVGSLFPVVCPNTIRVVGAARTGNQIILVPLVETTSPRGMQPHGNEPRRVQLYIPPAPGMMTFRIGPRDMLTGTEAFRVLHGYLGFVGAAVAYLHSTLRGAPDTDHALTRMMDPRTGKPLFHALDGLSPVMDTSGLKAMILEANSYMMDALVVDAEDGVLIAPPLLAAHVRALAAAADGAVRVIRECQARTSAKSSA